MMNEYGYNIDALDERKRRKIIIDFIAKNQYCTTEEVVRVVKKHIGRKKVFKILKDLKKDRIIFIHRVKPRSRSIQLFLNTENPLVVVPRELERLENDFTLFLENLVLNSSKCISALNIEVEFFFGRHKASFGKKRNARLTQSEISMCMNDTELHTSMEELSVRLSALLKVVEIVNELLRVYSFRFIMDWPRMIKDKGALNRLISEVSDKLNLLQVLVREKFLQVREKLKPFFRSHILDNDAEIIARASLDLDEMELYYGYFGLEKEIKPILSHIRNVRGDSLLDSKNLWRAWGIISPLEMKLDDVKEFFQPDRYYRDNINSMMDTKDF